MNMESITPSQTQRALDTNLNPRRACVLQAQEMAFQKQLGILNEQLKSAVAKSERLEQSHTDMEQKHKDSQAKYNASVCPSSLRLCDRLPRCSSG